MASRPTSFEILADYFHQQEFFVENEIIESLAVAMRGKSELIPVIFEIARRNLMFGADKQSMGANQIFVDSIAGNREQLAYVLGSTIGKLDNIDTHVAAIIYARNQSIPLKIGKVIYQRHNQAWPESEDELTSPYCLYTQGYLCLLPAVSELLTIDALSPSPGLQLTDQFIVAALSY